VLVQAYSFTSAPIAKALVEVHKRGVKVLAVLDKSNETDKYSAATFLTNAGMPPLIDDQHAIAHNKVMVIDSATILTGSFNFTKAAEAKNAEHLLVLKDAPALVKAYEQNIYLHAAHAHSYTRRAAPASSAASSTPETNGEVRGNRHSKVYRAPSCKGYASMQPASVMPFATEAEAQQAGYRRANDAGHNVPWRAHGHSRDKPLCRGTTILQQRDPPMTSRYPEHRRVDPVCPPRHRADIPRGLSLQESWRDRDRTGASPSGADPSL
jgi:hypothetical protein